MAFGNPILSVLPIGKVIFNSQVNGEDDLPCPWLDNLFVIGFGDFIMIFKINCSFDTEFKKNRCCAHVWDKQESQLFKTELGYSSCYVNSYHHTRSIIFGNRCFSRFGVYWAISWRFPL